MNRLIRHIEKYGSDSIKRHIMSDSYIKIEPMKTPSYMNHSAEILKNYKRDGRSDYYPSILNLGDGEKHNITINTDDKFSGIDLYLTELNGVGSVHISGKFITIGGDIKTDEISINNTHNFTFGDYFPITLSIDALCSEATIVVECSDKAGTMKQYGTNIKNRLLSSITHRDFVKADSPHVSMPVPVNYQRSSPPVILVSIDTLRYDTAQHLEPILSIIQEDAVRPAEPRTNGHWTPPSHASMFTGVHPGDHKYVGVGNASDHPIHPNISTIPELLSEQGYKCSGLASHARILPEGGFGRGFHRYYFQNMMNWLDRKNDARTAVNRVLKWIEHDTTSSQYSDRLFYFLHLFDPHMPYIPDNPSDELENFDLDDIEEFSYSNTGGSSLNDELADKVWKYYESSIEYTARQLARLIQGLKTHDIYDRSLLIITGDHGELFGEYNKYGHTTVHDEIIRPFMIVKPPAESTWSVPDTASTIDFLPTIAEEVGISIPNQCQGMAWQNMDNERQFRITEAIKEDSYQIATEHEGISAIFEYPEQYPERPKEEVEEGPTQEEYYRLAETRQGNISDCGNKLDHSFKQKLRDRAEEFISQKSPVERDSHRSVQAAEETEEQLEHLGYK